MAMHFRFPAPNLPPSVAAIRAEVRAFIAGERARGGFEPRANSWVVHDAEFSARLGAAGFIGIAFPREYGGRGLGPLERYAVVEELLAAGAPVGHHWIADRQSGPQILRHGHESVKRRVLPEIAAGRCAIGIGMSEPGAGSDLAGVTTRATKVDGGWCLSGRKLWTSGAHRAQYLIVLARSEGTTAQRHAGLTQFLLQMGGPGVTPSPIEDLTGARSFNEVLFEEAFVPDEHVLGEPGQGWALVTGELAWERSGPERWLSTWALLEALQQASADAAHAARGADGASESAGPAADAELGRLVAHAATLRHMSLSVAGRLDAGELPAVLAALVKDLGTHFEREVPDAVRRARPAAAVPGAAPKLNALYRQAVLAAPSFTLRGGTREILRGIVARELGLR